MIVATGLGAAVVVLAVFLIVGGDRESPYADRDSTDQRSSGPSERPASRLGQTLRLRTYVTTIEVRPVGFVSFPATESTGPGVGVDLVVRNVGREPYRDQPEQAASVTLRRGGEAERVYTSVRGCAGPPEDTIRIPRGATERFCLPFEATGRPDLFVYAPEDGLPGSRGAPEAGAWSLSK